MKKITIASILFILSIQTTFCMEITTNLIQEISTSVATVNKLVQPVRSSPKYLDAQSRTIALRELAEIQAKSKKLAAILADQDGWTTEESEK